MSFGHGNPLPASAPTRWAAGGRGGTRRKKTRGSHASVSVKTAPDISMDFTEGFLKVGGKSVIFTVVDRFSKYAHIILLSHPYSAASVAWVFFDDNVCIHGFPCSIVSDSDTVLHQSVLVVLVPTGWCVPSAQPSTRSLTVSLRSTTRSSPCTFAVWLAID